VFAPPPRPQAAAPAAAQPSAGVGAQWHAPGPAPAPASTASASAPASQAPPEADDEESLLGVVLGDRYRIDELIGSGGMGLVFKATHLLIGRSLAIKVLRRRYSEKDEVAQRFAQEARVASAVKHANVVDIIDFGSTPHGSPYCVMEFLGGHSLARELATNGPLEPARALDVACQVARGLAAAHQAGIIHRDLKPDNVFLIPADEQSDEQAKILDFGIARVAGRKTRLTKAGAVVGTPEYMSPEQARGDDLDPRSDLYALGIVLFESLTGEVPLSAESTVGVLTKQVFELAPRLRDMNPRFAAFPSVEAALGRLLAKNRDERPATALDAARLIQTAGANDLEVDADPRGRAVLDGWSDPSYANVSAHDLARRSTIMIGSGSVARAHDDDGDGPATGDFAAKQGDEEIDEELQKRPSVIIRGGVKANVRRRAPAPDAKVRSLGGTETPPDGVAKLDTDRSTDPVSRTPTPDGNRPLGKPPTPVLAGGLRRRHLPLILIGLGIVIFAALVTIGFVGWLKRREARTSDASGVRLQVADPAWNSAWNSAWSSDRVDRRVFDPRIPAPSAQSNSVRACPSSSHRPGSDPGSDPGTAPGDLRGAVWTLRSPAIPPSDLVREPPRWLDSTSRGHSRPGENAVG
jgi:serine/threonine protein kinase